MSSKTGNIFRLQKEVTDMRSEYPDKIRKYFYKINKSQLQSLENANYTAEYEPLDIPIFPLEKYEQVIAKSKENPEKMKTKLKSEIIVMRTLLRKEKCPMEELLK